MYLVYFRWTLLSYICHSEDLCDRWRGRTGRTASNHWLGFDDRVVFRPGLLGQWWRSLPFQGPSQTSCSQHSVTTQSWKPWIIWAGRILYETFMLYFSFRWVGSEGPISCRLVNNRLWIPWPPPPPSTRMLIKSLLFFLVWFYFNSIGKFRMLKWRSLCFWASRVFPC